MVEWMTLEEGRARNGFAFLLCLLQPDLYPKKWIPYTTLEEVSNNSGCNIQSKSVDFSQIMDL